MLLCGTLSKAVEGVGDAALGVPLRFQCILFAS